MGWSVARKNAPAASTAAQRNVREPALESAPVRERSPDWLIPRRQPGVADELARWRRIARRHRSPEAIVSPSRSPIPGMLPQQHHALVGVAAIARSSRSNGAARESSRSITASASAIESTPRLCGHTAPRTRASTSRRVPRSRVSERAQPPLCQQPEDPVLRRGAHPAPDASCAANARAARDRRLTESTAPARGRDGTARPAPARRPCRSCTPAARHRGPCAGARPARPSRPQRVGSRTQTAPLIISTHAWTSVPASSTSRARPSSSAGTHPLADDRAALAERAPGRPPIRPIQPEILHRRASLHGVELQTDAQSAPGRPSFMTFHALEQSVRLTTALPVCMGSESQDRFAWAPAARA